MTEPIRGNSAHVTTSGDNVCIHVLGRQFRTRRDLAQGFLRRVENGILTGSPELVPLLHTGGLELLYVTAITPMTMHDVRDRSFDAEHAGLGMMAPTTDAGALTPRTTRPADPTPV